MLLVTVATENEIKPLRQYLAGSDQVEVLVTGIGPVATAASLSHYLTLHGSGINGILNIGVGGAYGNSGLSMLDICLAQQEVLGDFGICMQERIQEFDPWLVKEISSFKFNNDLVTRFKRILADHNIDIKVVNFVTVNCCTGTSERGEFLREKYSAGCENMEGAAVALVCENFNIPWVELRCISNMVLDRDTTKWQLAEAIAKICAVSEIVLPELEQSSFFNV